MDWTECVMGKEAGVSFKDDGGRSMEKNKRRVVEGWVEKASTYLQTANGHFKFGIHFSDAVQESQVCVELSVKAILAFLDVDFRKSHGWDKEQLAKIAEQIQKKSILDKLVQQHLYIKLPRLLFLVNFWDLFYLQAKYGAEAGYLASAQDLFGRDEAELAVKHAEECNNAAIQLRVLPEDQLDAIVK
jgi:HEPN domain-containing protein